MENTTKLEKILTRNDYLVEKNDGKIFIRSRGRTSKTIKLYAGLGILLTVFGLALLLIFGSIWGLLFLSVSIPMFIQARRFSREQKIFSERQLTIAEDAITIDDGASSKILSASGISKIRYRFETSENLSTAKILVEEEGREYQLLQIFNDDKRDLDHDAQDVIKELRNLMQLNSPKQG